MKTRYQKHLDVLEIIALRGRVSSYELSKVLRISISHAQWWLKTYPAIREVEREKVRRQRVLYGLTMIGFLLALKRPKVRRNFAEVFEKFADYEFDKADPALKQNLLEALKSRETSERFLQYYSAISSALDDLVNIYELEDDMVVDLATWLAFRKHSEEMTLIFRDLYRGVLLFQRVVEAYRETALSLDRIIKGEA